mgnify:FL=1|tara:strand:+ start:55 stop:525 length:471 start_codon:yes stop_codon:yes gene_type:complete
MKYLILIITLILFSCGSASHKKPTEKCKELHLNNGAIYTYGFNHQKFDKIQLTVKDSVNKIDTSFQVKLSEIRDSSLNRRDIDLYLNVKTNHKIELNFGDSFTYEISDIKTEWIARYCHDFCGYECILSNCSIDGKIDSSGLINIKHPQFNDSKKY